MTDIHNTKAKLQSSINSLEQNSDFSQKEIEAVKEFKTHLEAEGIKANEIAEVFENSVESAEDNEIAGFAHNLVRALGNLAEEDLKEGDEYIIRPTQNPNNDVEDFSGLNDLASSFHGKLAYNLSITDQDTILAYDLGFASALVAEETPYNPKDFYL